MKGYPVAYTVEPHDPEEELPDGWGGADAVIVISLLFPPDGARGEAIYSIDANGQSLPDIELFKTWVGLAFNLKDSQSINEDARALARDVFEHVRQQVLETKPKMGMN